MDHSNTLYQISLIAAFFAGMVALFAPCCISYLLPAYFGNVFKEKKRILLMTFIYSLGIFTVMLPVVLGARALAQYFFKIHDQAFFIGGIFMLLVSVISLLGLKLPMISIDSKSSGKTDIGSTFTLGIISGITSSCCAPVLVGVMALSSLTPTAIQSVGVGFAYVTGMVAPLYIASLFIEKRNILQKPILRKLITKIKIGKKTYPIFVSNIISFAIFFFTGAAILIMLELGMLGMPSGESPIVEQMNTVAETITDWSQKIPGLNFIFAIGLVWVIIKIIKELTKEQ